MERQNIQGRQRRHPVDSRDAMKNDSRKDRVVETKHQSINEKYKSYDRFKMDRQMEKQMERNFNEIQNQIREDTRKRAAEGPLRIQGSKRYRETSPRPDRTAQDRSEQMRSPPSRHQIGRAHV